jgi:hypothetical protein
MPCPAPQHDLTCDDAGILMLVTRGRPPAPACPKCLLPPAYGADYCVPCGDFLPGTKVCGGCGTPTAAIYVARGICRSFTHYVPCNPRNGPPPPFRAPTPADKENALIRHRRLQTLRARLPPASTTDTASWTPAPPASAPSWRRGPPLPRPAPPRLRLRGDNPHGAPRRALRCPRLSGPPRSRCSFKSLLSAVKQCPSSPPPC